MVNHDFFVKLKIYIFKKKEGLSMWNLTLSYNTLKRKDIGLT